MKGKTMTTELSVMPALHVLNDIESPLPLEHIQKDDGHHG